MDLDETQQTAIMEYNTALKLIQKCETTKAGGARAEKIFGDASRNLTRLGLLPKIKRKYTGR